MEKTEGVHYIQAIQKHRFSIYVKCYDRHLIEILDLLNDAGYKVSGVEIKHFNQIYESFEKYKSVGVHVIAFMPFDGTEKIQKHLQTLK